jgi:hypothetical protein
VQDNVGFMKQSSYPRYEGIINLQEQGYIEKNRNCCLRLSFLIREAKRIYVNRKI